MDTGSLSKNINISTSRPTVGDALYGELLTAILNGKFASGERINDVALARELGISRTPVREALQRLKSLGVIEAEPNRFTRVAVISPLQTREYWLVYDALLRGLLKEIDGKVPAKALRTIKSQAKTFQTAAKGSDTAKAARANIELFAALTELSNNPALRQALESAQHIVQLGSPELFETVDLSALATAHEQLVDALENGKAKKAVDALDAVTATFAA
jgi:DNA-binding GntR family transcriptional regulator